MRTCLQYIEMYNKLIYPYPYSNFALVENFWETGYGMPSFTLLGPKIIRFPFILHSSFPHEILHNWWGNSVFVDYRSGNWCEGLTVFLSDHLIKEQKNQGKEYRRDVLQKYTNFVNNDNDLSINKFTSRHNSVSSAIGYGKGMMIFNMLRFQLGDTIFIKLIKSFFNENKYKKAGFDDLNKAFTRTSGIDHTEFFDQWVRRKGAPQIQLSEVSTVKNGKKILIRVTRSVLLKKGYLLSSYSQVLI